MATQQAMISTLAAAMEWRNMSQGELARRVGMQQPAISRILLGKQRLYADQLAAIAQALEVPPEWLIHAAEGPTPTPDDFRLRAEIERIIALVGPAEAYRRLVLATAPAATAAPRPGGPVPLAPEPRPSEGRRSGSA